MIEFDASVLIERPVDESLRLRLRPRELPALELGGADGATDVCGQGRAGARYAMTRDLPSGPAENELEITLLERPTRFAIRTVSGPTPFAYGYSFSNAEGQTLIELEAEVELPVAFALAGPLARRAIRRGVDENFAVLKTILERRAPQL